MHASQGERVRMPFTYKVDPNLCPALTTGTGLFLMRNRSISPRHSDATLVFHATMRELLDLRQVERLSITPDWLGMRAETDKQYAHEYANTLAIVVGDRSKVGTQCDSPD